MSNKYSQAYLDYIPYTNTKIKELIATIQHNTNDSAVIIFMGDHGFRENGVIANPSNNFQNQNAVYFPGKDYHLFYDSITNVNMFRAVFDKLFKQNIPLLKDSSIFLQDKH
jgi:arylsulfatase A-like enzyme